MVISQALLNEVIGHALADPANEVCGVIAVDRVPPAPPSSPAPPNPPARAVRVHRAANIHASPLRFEIDPAELLDLWQTIEHAGLELGAIYHSHVRSAPRPSQTDINFAALWPGVEWVIVGLAGGEPQARSYLIDGTDVTEVPLEVLEEAPA